MNILSKLSVPESASIAFSSVWKVLGLLLVLPVTPERYFISMKRFKNLFTYNQGLREEFVAGARVNGNTHAKLFCNQAQKYYHKPVASTSINPFLNLSMIAVFYIIRFLTNKVYNFRGGNGKLAKTVSDLCSLVKFPSDALHATMTWRRLNDLMILHVYKERVDRLDLEKSAENCAFGTMAHWESWVDVCKRFENFVGS